MSRPTSFAFGALLAASIASAQRPSPNGTVLAEFMTYSNPECSGNTTSTNLNLTTSAQSMPIIQDRNEIKVVDGQPAGGCMAFGIQPPAGWPRDDQGQPLLAVDEKTIPDGCSLVIYKDFNGDLAESQEQKCGTVDRVVESGENCNSFAVPDEFSYTMCCEEACSIAETDNPFANANNGTLTVRRPRDVTAIKRSPPFGRPHKNSTTVEKRSGFGGLRKNNTSTENTPQFRRPSNETITDKRAPRFPRPSNVTTTEKGAPRFHRPSNGTTTEKRAPRFHHQPSNETSTEKRAPRFHRPSNSTTTEKRAPRFHRPTNQTATEKRAPRFHRPSNQTATEKRAPFGRFPKNDTTTEKESSSYPRFRNTTTETKEPSIPRQSDEAATEKRASFDRLPSNGTATGRGPREGSPFRNTTSVNNAQPSGAPRKNETETVSP